MAQVGDTYTDTDGVELTAHTPTGASAGTSWAMTVGTSAGFTIQGNRAIGAVGGYVKEHAIINRTDAWDNDCKLACDFVCRTRLTDANNMLLVRAPTTGSGGYMFGYETFNQRFRLYKIATDGTLTQLGADYPYTFPAADTVLAVELEAIGTSIVGRLGGVDIITATDATHTSGQAGLYYYADAASSSTTGIHFDNFLATDMGTVAPTNIDLTANTLTLDNGGLLAVLGDAIGRLRTSLRTGLGL